MANFLQMAAGSLFSSLQAAGGISVTYFFGDYELSLIAVKADTEFQVESTGGYKDTFRIVDWIVKGSDLAIGGEEVEPNPGDIIQDGRYLYEVMPAGNLKHWEYVDPYRTMIRLHTSLREVNDESSY